MERTTPGVEGPVASTNWSTFSTRTPSYRKVCSRFKVIKLYCWRKTICDVCLPCRRDAERPPKMPQSRHQGKYWPHKFRHQFRGKHRQGRLRLCENWGHRSVIFLPLLNSFMIARISSWPFVSQWLLKERQWLTAWWHRSKEAPWKVPLLWGPNWTGTEWWTFPHTRLGLAALITPLHSFTVR